MKINHWDGYVLVCFYPSECPSGKSVNESWPFSSSTIRELSSKALHNLTPQAPDYMAETGKQCHSTCSPGNGVCDVCCVPFLPYLVQSYQSCCPWRWVLTSTAAMGPFWPARRSHTLFTKWAFSLTGRQFVDQWGSEKNQTNIINSCLSRRSVLDVIPSECMDGLKNIHQTVSSTHWASTRLILKCVQTL